MICGTVRGILEGRMMTVKTQDLPLAAIAKFCRHWGIAELYQVPTEVKPWTGPIQGYRSVPADEVPGGHATSP